MSNKNRQIAQFYLRLYELQDLLNAELLPLVVQTGVEMEDPQLVESMEVLAEDIREHLEKYRLSVEQKKMTTVIEFPVLKFK